MKWEGEGEGEGEVGGFKSEMIIKIHCSQEYMFFKNLNVCFKPKTFSSEMKKIPVKLNIFDKI